MNSGEFKFGTFVIPVQVWAYCTSSGWVAQYWIARTVGFPVGKYCETKSHPNTCCPLTFSSQDIQWCNQCPPPPTTPACCDPLSGILRLEAKWGTGGACKPPNIGSQTKLFMDLYPEIYPNTYWRGEETLGGVTTTIILRCDFNMATDSDAPGRWTMSFNQSDNSFQTCTRGIFYWGPTFNDVDCPGVLLRFNDAICDEDYVNGTCTFLSDIIITG